MPSDATLAALQSDVDTFRNAGLVAAPDGELTKLWAAKSFGAWQRLVSADGRLDAAALENFRRDEILVEDVPRRDYGSGRLRDNALTNALVGRRRATRQCLLATLDVLRGAGCADKMREHPCARVGNPRVFAKAGYEFTYRWARTVYFLGLFDRLLGERLDGDFVALDIGSSYGIFSALLKRACPRSRHVLVDLPEQLIAARYFLSQYRPDARIAGPTELADAARIDRGLCAEQDFVLLPAAWFDRLQGGSADVVTNFGSFCEMTRGSFEGYLRSDAFLSCRYFVTINRVEAKPGVHDDITILDYPVWDASRKLHFDLSPIYSVPFSFEQRRLFFVRQYRPPPFFEYVGRL
jgi:putative sugar O-methyltransferase